MGRLKLTAMVMATETEVDEVARLFEAYKLEHETSTLTLPQFRQIYAMRQSQRAPKDVSHIEMDDKSMHKTAEAAAQGAAAESKLQEARKVELKLHTRRKAAHLMAMLHERVPEEDQVKLMGWCRCALKENPPTLTIPELGNGVIGLCEKHLRDTEAGVDLECDLRELFAELLEIPLDSFNAESGGIPRRLFAAMLNRHRKKNAQVSKENAIPEDEEEDDGDRDSSARTGVRYRGSSSASEDLRPAPDEQEYLRRLKMLEQLPKDKLEKFMMGPKF